MPLDETTATIQYRAATDIAAERFAFPSEQFPDLETHLNLPVLKMPVQGPSAELLGPDIVVTNADGGLEMVASVEQHRSTLAHIGVDPRHGAGSRNRCFRIYRPVDQREEREFVPGRIDADRIAGLERGAFGENRG